MKTERRHELRSNDLSEFLTDANDWVKAHASRIGTVVIVAVIILVATTLVSRSRSSAADAAAESMRQLSFTLEDATTSFESLDRIIESANDRDFKMTALLQKGRSAMSLAIMQPDGFHPDFLDAAEDAYNALMQLYPDRTPVVATALLGLAAIEESRFADDGQLSHRETAKGHLNRLQNEPAFRGTTFQTQAARRLQSLDNTFQTVTIAAAPVPERVGPVDQLPVPPASPLGIKFKTVDEVAPPPESVTDPPTGDDSEPTATEDKPPTGDDSEPTATEDKPPADPGS